MQPALTVKAIVPAGGYGGSSYGGGNSYGNNNNYGRSIEVPVSSIYTSSGSYGKSYGAPPVDRQALGLAKLSLYAPSAGAPLPQKEYPQVIIQSYGQQQNYQQKQSYAEKAKGASAAAASAAVAGKKQEYQNSGYQNSGYQSSGY